MRLRGIALGGLLFAGGLGLGFWLGRGPAPAVRFERDAARSARPPTWEEFQEGLRSLGRLWSSRGGGHGIVREDGRGGEWFDPGRSSRSRKECLLSLQGALAAGNEWEARRALRDLELAEGEPLAPEDLQGLGALLGTADRNLLRDLSRALVLGGGAEGLSLVMGFLEDSSQPLERRRQALDGLADVPPERASEVMPFLAEFLGKGPPPDLERSAAHAIGRLAGDRGAETLLGLLGTHPGIRAEAVFDAVGAFGGPGESKALLALLGGDWSPGAKMSLLRSAATLAARGDDSSSLLGLLREPPAGVSREMVARALGDASRDLGPGILRDALRETAGDPQAQEAIARSLVWQGGKEGLEVLLDAASNPDLRLDQRVLARALNDFQGEGAVPLMLELFRSSRDEDVLGPLARGLARNATKETMDSLLGLLDSGGDAWQRRAVARALEDGGSGALGADRLFELLHGEKDQEVASSLARAMSRFYPGALDGKAADLLRSAAGPVERIAYASALERISAPGLAEIIGEQLRTETDSKAQWEMARILGRAGEDGIAHVADALRGEDDERHRHSLLWGLEASRRPVSSEARALFIQVAGADPSPSIRAQAAEILGRQQDPALIDVLSDYLGSEPNREVRERIERAIRELEGRR